MNSNLAYRPDIDGLRALAVVVVVAFHMGLTVLSGGFVGVDVFFVISGYLITLLLMKEFEANGRIAFTRFYMRRVRRLGPALIVVALSTLAAGYFVLAPIHLERLGRAAVTAVLSASNIRFWYEADYFDTASITKPLLHTWSLGVEEQFYLVWPALIVFAARRRGAKGVSWMAAGLGLLSLIAAEFLISRDSASTAFYLSPFRIGEFAAGALLALRRRPIQDARTGNLASVIGLVLVLLPVLLFDKDTRFPGVMAMIPCAGAALIIWSGPAAAANRLISWAPFVYLGRTSYSVYLVHWPIVVYYSYLYGFPRSLPTTVTLIIACFALGALMYHAVETPFRTHRGGRFLVSPRALLTGVGCAGLLTVYIGADMAINDGYKWRLPPEVRLYAERIGAAKKARYKAIRKGLCHFQRGKEVGPFMNAQACLPTPHPGAIAVVGDSHAADIWAGLAASLPHRQVYQFTGAGCQSNDQVKGCKEFMARANAWLRRHSNDFSTIIITLAAKNLMNGQADEGAVPAVADSKIGAFVSSLGNWKFGPRLIVWGPHPELHPEPEVIVATSTSVAGMIHSMKKVSVDPYFKLDARLSMALKGTGIRYLPSAVFLCPDHRCKWRAADGSPVYVDYGHLSPKGARKLVREMIAAYPVLTERNRQSDEPARQSQSL